MTNRQSYTVLFAGAAVLLLALIVWFFARDTSVITQAESVSGVSMEIESCSEDGAALRVRNDNAVAMEFAAAVDFVDKNALSDKAVLFPVRIAFQLEAGAERELVAPFDPQAASPGPVPELRCVGNLVGVAERS